ncbi:sigma-70 family RNA polymerase sigma factor [Fuscibacter oryzae]|uniref:Sigma-70 family RNA polymerase sigma factor n=1 Tax=Fuscibacter oryzae TaxID=2803939 RepID=A0A8J7MRM8_9RHOB|nr:sigma-70 family RNA polymerase sigma factor [Fuscibacter oryzae]MBL4930060.1 sigma-70 family RNA polymerase sigma factor [Fuscibacter oryzae]
MQATEDPLGILLVAANAGDGQAYARFLHAVAPIVRGIVRARGRGLPVDLHEDIVQDVLLAIHLKRQTWDAGHPLRPWLYAIVRYKVIDSLRARGKKVYLPIEDYSDVLPAEETADPLDARDDQREVDRLLGQLDPRSAEVVRALELREEPQAEVGVRLEMTPVNLRVTLHRAMKRLAALARKDLP